MTKTKGLFCSIALTGSIFVISLVATHLKNKSDDYKEISPKNTKTIKTKDYIFIRQTEVYGIPAVDERTENLIPEKYKDNLVTAIPIGIYNAKKKRIEQKKSAAWLVYSQPNGIVECRISKDGKMLLIKGIREGTAEIILASANVSGDTKYIKCSTVSWEKFAHRNSIPYTHLNPDAEEAKDGK